MRVVVCASVFYTKKARCPGMQSQIRLAILLFWRHAQVCRVGHYLAPIMWTALDISNPTTSPHAGRYPSSSSDLCFYLSQHKHKTCISCAHVFFFCTVWVISVRKPILAAHYEVHQRQKPLPVVDAMFEKLSG